MMNSFPKALQIDNNTSWQQLLSHTINDPEQLIKLLELPHDYLQGAQTGDAEFSLKVPTPYLNKIKKGDINDPLLRQILPIEAEAQQIPGYVTDPLAEMSANHHEGLIHKYKGRVLIILTGACAINCRYCFRRHFPYQENKLGPKQWQQVLKYLNDDESISEVIFSGGDPLATSDNRLAQMITDLEKIPHLTRLRIHTRLPIVLPQRITPEFTSILENSRFDTVMVLHANHPNEIDNETGRITSQLKSANVTVLNQSVLLKGVNDCVETLKTLSEKLFHAGILPYYLFTLDPVQGAAHFNVDDKQAIQLFGELQTLLPGYLLPKLAREIPERPSKTLLHP
ncbi:EF-P beta-lysylation protein EpmB [Neptuniibacter sp. UBA6509]|uniref:EF-P beta-lysylation protein EpmB n=2 Tax=unclassified Neptuniibacter TaxID=2630693 RepID=UPI0025F5A526|nr:EF-P beta-lysylation protein EpmB [Neptuniibacter sp. UBA6509]